MKSENLESLLLDRALCELSPAVSELLDEHLSQHPEATLEADALATSLKLARKAVALPCETTPPPLAIDRLRKVRQSQRRNIRLVETLRLAACIALGLVSGWYIRALQLPPLDSTTLSGEPQLAQLVPATPSSDIPSTPHFWSLARLQAAHRSQAQAAPNPDSRYRLQWDSSVKMPRVEERL